MSKIDRYYVDSAGAKVTANVVIRDRMSPMRDFTYPNDIVVTLTSGMFPSREKHVDIARKICELLNKDL